MKFGYHCKCGWHLNRGKLTRPQYALRKQNHALGGYDPQQLKVVPGCKFLASELALTQKDSDLKQQLLFVARSS
jgi:hypothetical protein